MTGEIQNNHLDRVNHNFTFRNENIRVSFNFLSSVHASNQTCQNSTSILLYFPSVDFILLD